MVFLRSFFFYNFLVWSSNVYEYQFPLIPIVTFLSNFFFFFISHELFTYCSTTTFYWCWREQEKKKKKVLLLDIILNVYMICALSNGFYIYIYFLNLNFQKIDELYVASWLSTGVITTVIIAPYQPYQKTSCARRIICIWAFIKYCWAVVQIKNSHPAGSWKAFV